MTIGRGIILAGWSPDRGEAGAMGTRFLETGRGRLHVDDGGGEDGKKTPVVFVHGAGATLGQWAAQLEHLRRSRRAVAFDLPGMGRSDRPTDGDWTPEAMAHALHAVLLDLALPQVVLVGHSYGGNVVSHYAATRPDRVAGLVLVDTASWTPNVPELNQIRLGFRPATFARFMEEDWIGPSLKDAREATRAQVLAEIRAFSRDAWLHLLFSMYGFDLDAAALAYPGPRLALCVAGTWVEEVWRKAGVEVATVAGVSHWLQLDDPAGANAALDRFLTKLP